MRKRILKFAIIFTLIFCWIFSGWPQIWKNLGGSPVPPEIKEAEAQELISFRNENTKTYDFGDGKMRIEFHILSEVKVKDEVFLFA